MTMGTPSSYESRFQAFLDADPPMRRMNVWSKWLGRGAVPVIAITLAFAVTNLGIDNVWWLGLIGVLIVLPSGVLSIIVIRRFYQSSVSRLHGE